MRDKIISWRVKAPLIQRLLFGLMVALLGLLLAVGVKSIQLFAHIDVSLQKPVAPPQAFQGNLWLVSYGEGEVYQMNQRALVASGLNKNVDFFLSYSSKSLEADFVLRNYGILKEKRGVGLWLWKPYIIDKTLKKIPEGDMILYLDSGYKITHALGPLIDAFHHSTAAIAVIEAFQPLKKTVKRDVLKIMAMDEETIHQERQIAAGTIFVKNTPQGRQLMAQWLALCQRPGMIDDRISGEEYPEFVEHKNDQAILTLLRLKHPKSFGVIPYGYEKEYFFWHHRTPEHFKSKPKSILLFDQHGLSPLDCMVKGLLNLYRKYCALPLCPREEG